MPERLDYQRAPTKARPHSDWGIASFVLAALSLAAGSLARITRFEGIVFVLWVLAGACACVGSVVGLPGVRHDDHNRSLAFAGVAICGLILLLMIGVPFYHALSDW
jgi:hypothetical protein